MVNKKRVSKILILTLLITSLFSGLVFAADMEKADDVTIKATAHIQTHGDVAKEGKGEIEIGTTGESKRIEALKLDFEGLPKDMKIRYKGHVQKIGDVEWVESPAELGTRGEAKRLERLAIELVDAKGNPYPGYSVEYQVHMRYYGWGSDNVNNWRNGKENSWAKDGEWAGTEGEALRLEAVRVKILKDRKLEANVSANNLKEITVSFNKPVDFETATNISRYKTNVGTAIKDVELSDDFMEVRLLLDGTMTNNKEYKLDISGVKAQDGSQTITERDIAFRAYDNELPYVEYAQALGKKAIRVYMSEPVKGETITSADFKIDGKAYFGPKPVVNGRVITLKPYSTTTVLTEGTHELTVSKLEDYAGYKSLEQTVVFDVYEDKTALEVVNAYGTLERVVVVFNKEIDNATKDNFYWIIGSSMKRKPATATIKGNRVILDFSNNPLPAYETILVVDGVTDFFGNKLAKTEVPLKAEFDVTRPVVTEFKFDSNHQAFTVTFDKSIDKDSVEKISNYKIKDKDGKDVNILNRATKEASNKAKVTLYRALPDGDYTIEIAGITDTTVLKNAMEPYTITYNKADKSRPDVSYYSGNGRDITIIFDKVMDIETIANPNNYLIAFGNATSWRRLPAATDFAVIADGKGIAMKLPATIDGKKVDAGKNGNVYSIEVSGVKDIKGLELKDYKQVLALVGSEEIALKVEKATLKEPKKIEVEFNQAIVEVGTPTEAFSLTGVSVTVEDVKVDNSNIVVLELKDNLYSTKDVKLDILANNEIKSIVGNTIEATEISDIGDEVAPFVDEKVEVEYVAADRVIKITFSEAIQIPAEADQLAANDLEIVNESAGKTLAPVTDYTVKAEGQVLKVTLTDKVDLPAGEEQNFTVKVKDRARIYDSAMNTAKESSTIPVSVKAESADKTGLTQKIDEIEAEKLDKDMYTEETWTALQDALKAAKAVKEKANATQKEADDALTVLQGARDALRDARGEVAADKVKKSSTWIDGVDLATEAGKVTISYDSTIELPTDQDPNEGLGGKQTTIYVGIHVERPSEEITMVQINDGKGDRIVELGDPANATTATGRWYYFPVGTKEEDGNVTAIKENKTWEITIKWYDVNSNLTIQKLEVNRVVK